MDALNRDLVDIAFISSVTPNQLTDIRWRKIQQMENAVVMHPSHTLASRESIDVKELINEKFVMVDPQESSVLYGMNTQLCMSNGFIPTNIIFAKQVPSLLFMVSCMQGIAILPSENKKFYTHELSYVPLKNKEFQINRLVAWKDVNNNPNIPIFISELDCFLASQDLLSAQECLATQQETKKQAVP
jgi:DNA-binding transcriptional LysR family regulator